MPAKKMLLATGLLAVTFLTACNSNRDPDMDEYAVSTVNALDARFIQNAMVANNAEIMTSKLALTHYRNDTTKMFAEMMVAEHQFAQKQLQQLGNKVGVEADAQDTYLDAMNQKFYDSLKTKAMTMSKTREWDKTYIEIQRIMHERAVTLFRAEALNTSGDSSVVRYAQNWVGKIEDHKRVADSIYARMK
jgi:putative membrane protein